MGTCFERCRRRPRRRRASENGGSLIVVDRPRSHLETSRERDGNRGGWSPLVVFSPARGARVAVRRVGGAGGCVPRAQFAIIIKVFFLTPSATDPIRDVRTCGYARRVDHSHAHAAQTSETTGTGHRPISANAEPRARGVPVRVPASRKQRRRPGAAVVADSRLPLTAALTSPQKPRRSETRPRRRPRRRRRQATRTAGRWRPRWRR